MNKDESKKARKLVLKTIEGNLKQINDFLKSDEAYCYYYFMKYLETKDAIVYNSFKERYEKLDNAGKARVFTYIIEGVRKEKELEVMAPEKSKVKNK